MRQLSLLLLLLFSTLQTYAQDSIISGTVKSSSDQMGLPGATVELKKMSDATSQGVVTDIEGNFRLQADTGNYQIKIQFIGFLPVSKKIHVSTTPLEMGDIVLSEETTTLQEIEITAKALVGQQKGDTSQYNASAFKTAKDANAQDLVEKMPGIMMQDGKMKAQGEDVQQILIDGKPFFGKDVNSALQNLPAEIIAGIQVYDEKSDKAMLSGFDDGERTRTINIITKPNRRRGQFGRATAGYGTDQRYLAGASVNLFNEQRRVTLTGLSNNINTVNYSSDPNNQGDSRTQNGLINTNMLGINFINSWNDKVDLSGSYTYTHRNTDEEQSKIRDYITASDSGQVYTENNNTNTINSQHQMNVRLKYTPNDRNTFLVRPSISLQDNNVDSYFFGNTVMGNAPLNQTENASTSDNKNYDFSNRMYYSHKFSKPGRSINMRLNTGYHFNQDDSYRQANNIYYNAGDRNEELNQYTRLDRAGFNWEGNISYTEPLSEHSMIEVEYELGNRLNDSDKRTYDFEEGEGAFSALDTAISNTFESRYLTQETELGYQYKTEKFRVQLEAQYQHASLLNDQLFPQDSEMERDFQSILPSARLIYKFSDTRNIEFNYRTWTQEPSIGQLQAVVDNSNPLQLRTGNPNLNQSYSNWIRTRFKSHNPETSQSFYAVIQSTFVRDYITNSTFIAEEPTEVAEGIVLEEGSQLSSTTNIDGYLDVRSYFGYGQPLDMISSNIHFNGSVRYARRPGLINEEINLANTSSFRLGTSLSSNISENVDFRVSTRSSYNIVDNSLRPTLNSNYFNQTTSVSYDWVLWEGLVYRTDLRHQFNTGYADDFDNSYLLWNMSIGKKLFRDRMGEISLNVYDLLKQNNNINRNITEAFVEDTQSRVLQRYFMLSFTYNIRHFGGGTTMEDYEELHRN